MGTEGPVGVVTAGWEEREDATGELDEALDHRSIHFRLYHRLNDVLAKDETFAAAAVRHRDRQDELTALYRLRLEHTLDGVYAVQRRIPAHPARARRSLALAAFHDAVAGVRRIDDWFLGQMAVLEAELADAGGIERSGVIGWHREELKSDLARCSALVIPGGNVNTLVRVLRLFAIVIPQELPVLAWSAGAMALTERIALFHDFGPAGSREAELLSRGVGRVRGVVAFPHPRRRLRLDDRERSSALALRFDPARCLLLDDGAWVEFGADGALPADARILGTDGLVHTEEVAG